MPFGAVLLGLCFFAAVVACFRRRFYQMQSAYVYLKVNLWLRFLINFFLPLSFYSALTIRDKDVSCLSLPDQRPLHQRRVAALLRHCPPPSPRLPLLLVRLVPLLPLLQVQNRPRLPPDLRHLNLRAQGRRQLGRSLPDRRVHAPARLCCLLSRPLPVS